MKLLEDLKWRYATKKFDHKKEVGTEEINIIKQSIQLAATSFGLQLFKVIEVKDKAITCLLESKASNRSISLVCILQLCRRRRY